MAKLPSIRRHAKRPSWAALVSALAVLGLLVGACAPAAQIPTPTAVPKVPTLPPQKPPPATAVSPVVSPAARPADSSAASPIALPTLVAVTANGDERTLSVVDVATARVLGTVQLDGPAHHVALTPDGRMAFASDSSPGSNSIFVADLAGLRQDSRLTVGAQPAGLAVHPRVPVTVVANSGDDSVTIFDSTTRVAVGTPQVGEQPLGVGIAAATRAAVAPPLPLLQPAPSPGVAAGPIASPQTNQAARSISKAFVANQDAGSISVLDLDTRRPLETIRVGGRPTRVAIAADDSQAFVLNETSGSVHVLDVATHQQVAEIQVGDGLTDLAVGPGTGEFLFVTARDPSRNLYKIDLGAQQVVQAFNALDASATAPSPGALAVAAGPDPGRLLVTTSEGKLVFWDAANDRVAQRVDVGREPVDVAVAATAARRAGAAPSPAASPAAQRTPAPGLQPPPSPEATPSS